MSDGPRLPETHAIVATDGYVLQAMRYPAQGVIAGRLIVAGATGVPQRFYSRFAQFAADQGLEVWTLDYRGIGLSRPERLQDLRMNYLDWARLDLAALLDHVARMGNEPIWMVGHSYGGHAFGILPDASGSSASQHSPPARDGMDGCPPPSVLRVVFMWRVLGPLMVRAKAT